jgi:hypothetical protein
VSFTERTTVYTSDVVPQANSSDEDKSLGDKIQDWSTVETSESLYDEDDSIFHPDDEIIVDPKESMEAPIKRVCITESFDSRRVLVHVHQDKNGLYLISRKQRRQWNGSLVFNP